MGENGTESRHGEILQREVRVPLPLAAVESCAGKLASLLGERERTAQAAKNTAAAYRSELKELDAQISELGNQLRVGCETVLVDCVEQPDPAHHSIRVVRIDTGETIEERSMTPAEVDFHAQLSLT